MSVLEQAKKYYHSFIDANGRIYPAEMLGSCGRMEDEQIEFFAALYDLLMYGDYIHKITVDMLKYPDSLRETIKYIFKNNNEEVTEQDISRILGTWVRDAKKLDNALGDSDLFRKIYYKSNELQQPIKYYTDILYGKRVKGKDVSGIDKKLMVSINRGMPRRNISDDEFEELVIGLIKLSKEYLKHSYSEITDREAGYYRLLSTSYYKTKKETQRLEEIKEVLSLKGNAIEQELDKRSKKLREKRMNNM